MPKQYLGDSVYVDIDERGILLTTENGYGPNNTIILEPEVYEALTKYLDRHWYKPQQPTQKRQ